MTCIRLSMIALLLMLMPGCEKQHATREQCLILFDTLVELELSEMGFRDSLVAQAHQRTLRRRYEQDINECIGRSIPKDAIECATQATSTEQLSHECLHN